MASRSYNDPLFTLNCILQLLKEAMESQRMYELMKQQEVHLKQQVRDEANVRVVKYSRENLG